MVRISYRGERKQFSSGYSIEPRFWISKESSIPELSPGSEYIHSNLLLLQDKLNRTYLQLQLEGNDFSVEDIYTRFQRKDIRQDHTILDLFEELMLKRKSPLQRVCLCRESAVICGNNLRK